MFIGDSFSGGNFPGVFFLENNIPGGNIFAAIFIGDFSGTSYHCTLSLTFLCKFLSKTPKAYFYSLPVLIKDLALKADHDRSGQIFYLTLLQHFIHPVGKLLCNLLGTANTKRGHEL